MVLIRELKFGSFLTYTPRGTTEDARKSQNIMLNLKNENSFGEPPKSTSEILVEKIKNKIQDLPFKDFFGTDVALVPVPKHSLMRKDALWVPDRIVKALEKQGLGKRYACLKREIPVVRSSTAANADRPKAQKHFETIKCEKILPLPTKIVLIDDIVTRGSTLLGCASKIKEIFPESEIYAFAIIRTVSNANEFEKIEKPCAGVIDLRSNDETHREP